MAEVDAAMAAVPLSAAPTSRQEGMLGDWEAPLGAMPSAVPESCYYDSSDSSEM